MPSNHFMKSINSDQTRLIRIISFFTKAVTHGKHLLEVYQRSVLCPINPLNIDQVKQIKAKSNNLQADEAHILDYFMELELKSSITEAS
jgi:hypothetical protein